MKICPHLWECCWPHANILTIASFLFLKTFTRIIFYITSATWTMGSRFYTMATLIDRGNALAGRLVWWSPIHVIFNIGLTEQFTLHQRPPILSIVFELWTTFFSWKDSQFTQAWTTCKITQYSVSFSYGVAVTFFQILHTNVPIRTQDYLWNWPALVVTSQINIQSIAL